MLNMSKLSSILSKVVLFVLLTILLTPSMTQFSESADDEWSAWKYSKKVVLSEDRGLERANEVVTVKMDFAPGECVNATKEIRVTDESGQEVTSQVLEEVYSEGWCVEANVAFLAQQEPNSRREYIIYYGNTQAEKPEYAGILVTKKGGVWQLTVGYGFVEVNPDGTADLFLYGTPVGTLNLPLVYDNPWVGMYSEIRSNKLVEPPEPILIGALISVFRFQYSSRNVTNTADVYVYYSSEDLRLFVEQEVTVIRATSASASGRGVDYLRLAAVGMPFIGAYDTCGRKTTQGLYQIQENISAYMEVILERGPPNYLYAAVEDGPQVPADWVVMWGDRGVSVGMLASYMFGSSEGMDWWFSGGFHSWGGRINMGINAGLIRFPLELKSGEFWRGGLWVYAYSGFNEEGMASFAEQMRSPLLQEDVVFHVYNDETGVPVRDALVELYNATSALRESGVTDSGGDYRVSELRSGFYQVLVTASGFQSRYEVEGLCGGLAQILLKPVSEPALTLRVYWPNGSVVPDADAEVSVGGEVFKGYGNKLGVYEFSGLPEGSAEVKVSYNYDVPDLNIHISRANQTSVDLEGHVYVTLILSEAAPSQMIDIIAGVAVVAVIAVVVSYKMYISKRRKS